MTNNFRHKLTASALIAAAALLACDGSAAFAKSQNKPAKTSATAAAQMGAIPMVSPAPKPGQHDTKPGPAWQTVGGTVKSVQGDMYMVEDYNGNDMKLYIGQGTKHLRGTKRVGDPIRAEITRGGFANSVQ